MLEKLFKKQLFAVATLLICCVAILGIVWLSSKLVWKAKDSQPSFRSTGPTITSLQSMGHLVVLKCSIGDVLEANDGTFKGAWIIKGDSLVAVDLRQAKLISTDEVHRKMIIQLPNPKPVSSRIDHSKTKTYSFQRARWLFIPGWGDQGPLRDHAMLEAQRLVEFACSRADVLEEARKITLLMIRSLYQMAGYTVEIRWSTNDETTDQRVTARVHGVLQETSVDHHSN